MFASPLVRSAIMIRDRKKYPAIQAEMRNTKIEAPKAMLQDERYVPFYSGLASFLT
jgi:hypothetical protein